MKILFVLLFSLLAGCGGSVPDQTSDEITVGRGPDQRPEVRPGRLGDPMIHQGFLFLTETAYEFRPCNKEEIYVVDASFAVIDALDQFASTRSSNPMGPLFVRFHGNEIKGTDSLPDRYSNAVNVTELVAQSDAPPAGCK
jgi:hypothetical protein